MNAARSASHLKLVGKEFAGGEQFGKVGDEEGSEGDVKGEDGLDSVGHQNRLRGLQRVV